MIFIKKCIQLFVIAAIWSSNIHASVFSDFADWGYSRFTKALSHHEQNYLVAKRFSRSALCNLKDTKPSELDFHNIFEAGVEDITDSWNLASLVISLGWSDKFEKFVEIIDDINSPCLDTWGWHQKNNLVHVALNPHYLIALDDVPFENRLRIVDILANKGANFNYIPNEMGLSGEVVADYFDPPLNSRNHHDMGSIPEFEVRKRLQARASIYGANPNLIGSSFSGIRLYRSDDPNTPEPVTQLAYKYFEEKYMAGNNSTSCPHSTVLNAITDIAERKIFSLQAMVGQCKAKLDHENIVKK